MFRRSRGIVSVMVLLVISTTACDAIIGEPIAQIPGLAETFVAETLIAQTQFATVLPSTRTPAPSPTIEIQREITEIASPLASQADSLEIVSIRTSTPLPSLTPDPSTAVYVDDSTPLDPDAPCNAAQYIRDVTIPDNTVVNPKEKFTKVWAIRNVGKCTWKKGEYAMVLNWGAEMGTDRLVPLTFDVKPGQTAELAIDMEAPAVPACWQSNWMLQDGEGNRFGVGPYYGNYFWVLVNVWWDKIPKIATRG